MKHLFLLVLIVSLSGCGGVGTRPTSDNIMSRYISPLKYSDYLCSDLSSAFKELRTIEVQLVSRINQGKPDAERFIKWKYKNEVHNDAVLNLEGVGIIRGHLTAIDKYARSENCII